MISTFLAAWNFLQQSLLVNWLSWQTYWKLRLRGAKVDKGLVVRGGPLDIYIDRRARVHIGTHCRFNSGFVGNAVGGFRRTGIWVSNGGVLTIGQNVGISGTTIVCANAVTIEDDVFIGGDCAIYDTDFHSIHPDKRLTRPDLTAKTAPITIRRWAFIGAHSLILKGVTIGETAVIGAGSVIAKDVPAGEIWAGNPARRIGQVDR